MTTTPFWKSVRELAEMWQQIPKERRETSGVESAIRADTSPARPTTPSERGAKGEAAQTSDED